MTRVIVHAGFHKTGTTSLQSFLKRNTDALAPYAAIYLQRALKRARYLGRIYGQRPVFWRRWMFRRGFREFLASIPDAPTIVISRESFSGMMLGYRGARLRRCRRYASMAIPLAREIIELRRRFGPEVEIEFLYTTREGESFLKSTWGHVLRTSRLTLDYESFRASFGALPDLEAEAREIAEAIAPVPVFIAPLESFGPDRFGPARALLDMLDLPAEVEAGLKPAMRNNPGQSEALSQRFLEMNRGSLRGRALYSAKETLAMDERPAATRRKPKYPKAGQQS
ncbi:MAG: hypothetical protein P8X50_13630 [Maritimibacter sp.]